MKKRKIIALMTTNPEAIYQTRIMEGVFDQCAKYGYDVLVFATLVQMCHYYKDYLKGEVNIYDLLNFDMVDGVIFTSISFSDNNTMPIFDEMLKKFQKECKKEIVAIDLPFGDYPVSYTDDRGAFKEIAEHIFDVHKCKNVYFLTGIENYKVSENRLGGYLDFLEERGMQADKSKIFYGDFWYSSGEKLAERICSGELEMPDAVICASDHMAIGLANRLIEHGVKVPEQVIVTGYDATQEAVINDLSITSYEPKVSRAAAEAVNMIHRVIEPEVPEQPVSHFERSGLRIGESCGCTPDIMYLKQKVSSTMYLAHHNLVVDKRDDSLDISRLLDSYMYEQLISAKRAQQCLDEIFLSTIYIKPFKDFYLCLRENWLEAGESCTVGYPDRMRLVIHSDLDNDSKGPTIEGFTETDKRGAFSFDTKLMLPDLYEEREEPSAFYFSPVHFNDDTLGYTVLRCDIHSDHHINYVFRNWVRYVNNALEITRIRTGLQQNSMRDSATGLFNRRGMYEVINDFKIKNMGRSVGKKMLVIMADMDGLKYINDNFGHNEGDFGILSIAQATKEIKEDNEVAIRYAGDEFLIIGVNDYTEELVEKKLKRLQKLIFDKSENSGKPYKFSASVGYCLEKYDVDINIDRLIDIADERMYLNKRKKHKNRA